MARSCSYTPSSCSTPPDLTTCDPFVCVEDIDAIQQDIFCSCPKFLQDDGVNVTIGQCGITYVSQSNLPVPGPPIKQLLNGTTQSPWVRLAFQKYCSDDGMSTGIIQRSVPATNKTIITTGNISQPANDGDDKCSAVIKSFQYGWGTANAGNKCTVTILDQKGSEFETWVKERLVKNVEGASHPYKGIYQMKVQFGWFITGGGPDDVCGQPFATPGTDPTPAGYNTSHVWCSPILWFMPDSVSASYDGNKFVFEIQGADLLVRGQENTISQTFGSDIAPEYFVNAVQELGRVSTPPFNVCFKQRNQTTGAIEDLRFIKRPGANDDDVSLGPLDKWVAYQINPLATIHQWLKGVLAEGGLVKDGVDTGRGITMNYDSTYDKQQLDIQCNEIEPEPDTCNDEKPDVGRLTLWADPKATCQSDFTPTQLNGRIAAVYIINGGSCSPVLSFNPTVRWNFFAALKGGGSTIPTSGKMQKQSEGAAVAACAISGGVGPRVETHSSSNMINYVNDVKTLVQAATVKHTLANQGVSAIEAELRIQGDPSLYYSSPIYGAGKTVGIVFINPFYLDAEPGETCPSWTTLTSGDSVCNSTFTNKAWFIRGVDHQIREGSYITILKLTLPLPGSEMLDAPLGIGSTPTHAGGDPDGIEFFFGGWFACLENWVRGLLSTFWKATSFPLCTVSNGIVFHGSGEECEAAAPPM